MLEPLKEMLGGALALGPRSLQKTVKQRTELLYWKKTLRQA